MTEGEQDIMVELSEAQINELESIIETEGVHVYGISDFCNRYGCCVDDIVEDLILAAYSVGYKNGLHRIADRMF